MFFEIGAEGGDIVGGDGIEKRVEHCSFERMRKGSGMENVASGVSLLVTSSSYRTYGGTV